MTVRVRFTFVKNLPPCAEFGVMRKIEENLPNGAENAKIFLIFVLTLSLTTHATHAQQLYCLRKVHDCTCNTDTG